MDPSPGLNGDCYPPVDLMRSEEMQLVQVIVLIESSHLTISYLGDFGLLQFKDDLERRRWLERKGRCSSPGRRRRRTKIRTRRNPLCSIFIRGSSAIGGQHMSVSSAPFDLSLTYKASTTAGFMVLMAAFAILFTAFLEPFHNS